MVRGKGSGLKSKNTVVLMNSSGRSGVELKKTTQLSIFNPWFGRAEESEQIWENKHTNIKLLFFVQPVVRKGQGWNWTICLSIYDLGGPGEKQCFLFFDSSFGRAVIGIERMSNCLFNAWFERAGGGIEQKMWFFLSIHGARGSGLELNRNNIVLMNRSERLEVDLKKTTPVF